MPVSLLAHITETIGDVVGQQLGLYSSRSRRPFAVHLEVVDDVAFLFQILAQGQDGRMLDDGGDDLLAFRLGLERREDGGGVGLGAAGGEDDLRVVLGAEQLLHLHARLLDRQADLVAEAVHRRGVAELLGEERQHGFHHGRIDAAWWRCCRGRSASMAQSSDSLSGLRVKLRPACQATDGSTLDEFAQRLRSASAGCRRRVAASIWQPSRRRSG